MVPGPCSLQGREESRHGLSQEPSSPLPLGKPLSSLLREFPPSPGAAALRK